MMGLLFVAMGCTLRAYGGDLEVDSSPDGLAKRAHAAFTVAWSVTHDKKAEPSAACAKIYADGWPGPIMWAMALPPGKLQAPEDASAEDIIAGKFGKVSTEQLWIETQALTLDFLGKHADEFEKILKRGIAGSPEELRKAGWMFFEFRRLLYKRADWKDGRTVLKEDDARVLNALSKGLYDATAKHAAGIGTLPMGDPVVTLLREIDDPRAIPLLIEKGGETLTHFEALRSLQRKRPADPALTAKLSAALTEARWRAVYALAESGDESLVPRVPALLKDADAQVRTQALDLAHNLQPKFNAETDAAVKALLNDADMTVRKACIRMLSFHQDAACAPALLRLLREGLKHLAEMKQYTNQEFMEYNVLVEDMERLTGNRFGYDVSAWPADTAANKAALEKFAEWIASNTRR
jgi:HEAT repeat protein